MLAALYSVSPVLLILLSCCFFAATLHFGRGGAKFSQNCQWFMDKSLYGIENVTFLAQYRASFEGIFE